MPDLNLDRLKAVSELLWAIVSDLQAKKYDANEYLSTSDGGYEITVGDILTFADHLLRLADEKTEYFQTLSTAYNLLRNESMEPDETLEHLSFLIGDELYGGDKTPASAGGGRK